MLDQLLKYTLVQVESILKSGQGFSPGYRTALLNLVSALKEVLKYW